MTKARDLANASTALSAVSPTELGYLDGVTSAVQTQIDSKAASATAVSTAGGSTITVASGTTVPLTIQNNGTGNSLVVNDVASDTTPFVINADGQVGIGGSAAANVKLAVVGGRTVVRANNEPYSVSLEYGSGKGQYYIGATDSVSAPDLVMSNINGVERVRVTDSGDVGIGKTPSYKLDVDGTVNATALYVGGSPLSSGGMTLIASVSPTGVGTYTFSSIPSTYKHLLVVVESLGSSAGEVNCAVRFNGDTAANYSRNWVRVVSTTVTGTSTALDQNSIYLGNINAKNTTASERLQSEFWVWDYASSHPLKRLSGDAYGRGFQTGTDQWAHAPFSGSWNNSSAINSLTIFEINGPYNFSNGTIKLYGVS